MTKTDTLPLILAIESATPVTSVALFRGDALLGCLEYMGENQHSRLLTLQIETLLQQQQIKPQELSAISVSSGPGSYTGLRVGVSAAKGLCMALEIPLLSLGSLECLAWQVAELATSLNARICPLIDARRMEVYGQWFSPEVVPVTEPFAKIVKEDSFADECKEGPVIFCGNGAGKCAQILSLHSGVLLLQEVYSSARFMGRPAYQKLIAGKNEDIIAFEPFYLKDFVTTIQKKGTLNDPAKTIGE